MLNEIFIKVLSMSVTASYVILLVMILRMILTKAPKIFSYVLWAAVLVRLVCPFSIESFMGLVPKVNLAEGGYAFDVIMTAPQPHVIDTVISGSDIINSTASDIQSFDMISAVITVLAVIWAAGIAVMTGRNIYGMIKLDRHLKSAEKVSENIYISDKIDTAFVMGVMNPKIYLPDGLMPKEMDYILLHEQTHIRRFDHIIKIIAFCVLSVHWFNPFAWMAFFASSKDMEMSCDEAVIKILGNSYKKDYSRSLLSLASGKRSVRGIPLSFSEGDTKSRIKNILSYKKPTFWVVILLISGVIIAGFALTTDRKSEELPADMMYAGVDSEIIEIDRENRTIHAGCLHENLPVYPEFTAYYDDLTLFMYADDAESEDLSIDDFEKGDKVVFVISDVEIGETVTAYAETVQKFREGEASIPPVTDESSDINHIICDLWFKVNNAYNLNRIDNSEDNVFNIGESETSDSGDVFYEILNYDEVMHSIFTDNGIKQFEKASSSLSEPFIRRMNGKTYRLGSVNTAYNYENALSEVFLKKYVKDEMLLMMKYIHPENSDEYGWAYFTIKNQNGKWLADDYIFPENHTEAQIFSSEDALTVLMNYLDNENLILEFDGDIMRNNMLYASFIVTDDENKYHAYVSKNDGRVVILMNDNLYNVGVSLS